MNQPTANRAEASIQENKDRNTIIDQGNQKAPLRQTASRRTRIETLLTARIWRLLGNSVEASIQENKDRNYDDVRSVLEPEAAGGQHPGEQGSKPVDRRSHARQVRPLQADPGEQGSKLLVGGENADASSRQTRSRRTRIETRLASATSSASRAGRPASRRTRIETSRDDVADKDGVSRQTSIQENKDRNTGAWRRTRGRNAAPADQHPGEQGSKPCDADLSTCRRPRPEASIQENKDRNRQMRDLQLQRRAGRPASRRTRIETMHPVRPNSSEFFRQTSIQENKDRNP